MSHNAICCLEICIVHAQNLKLSCTPNMFTDSLFMQINYPIDTSYCLNDIIRHTASWFIALSDIQPIYVFLNDYNRTK